jgi:hypothetical protein
MELCVYAFKSYLDQESCVFSSTKYQKFAGLKWSYDVTYHIMVELDTVIALANLTYDAMTNTYKLHPSDEKSL